MSLEFKESTHRYKLDGKPVTGATTIIKGGIPNPALVWWAGGVVAKYVIDHQNAVKVSDLQAGDPDEGVKFLQLLPNRERDMAGERGTAVHDMAERLIHEGTLSIDPELKFLESFILGYADFLDAWQITPVLTERTVGNRKHWYAGKFDLYATSPLLLTPEEIAAGKLVQIDLKTSKGVYMETALQTAAYARAEFYMDGTTEVPMPDIVKTFVAHVTPLNREGEINSRYEGSPLGTTLYRLAGSPAEIDEHFEQFLHAKAVHEDAKGRKKVDMLPMIPPVPAVRAAA